MEQFRTYSPEDIILSNLEETTHAHTAVFEQELAHLAELAEELVSSNEDDTETLSGLPDFHLPESVLTDDNILPQHRDMLQKLQLLQWTQKKLLLVEEIRKKLGLGRFALPNILDYGAERTKPVEDGRIIYQKSVLTDTAYLQFAKLLNAPRASYAKSFLEACENVYNGICQYCILPLENNSEGRMINFTKLIDRFGLKIVMTSDVLINDGTDSIRFALLQRELHTPYNNASYEGQYLEIAFHAEATPTLAELLTAAQLCGLTLSKIHEFPAPEDPERVAYHTIFQIGDALLSTFLLYLAMEVPHHIPIGIYTHFKSK